MSLIEILVVLAIGLMLVAVMIPATRNMLALDQRAAARNLAQLYQQLHDEAIMRNRTFRISFYLDENRYVVEPGEPGALIAATPEDREKYEQETRRKLAMMDEEQKRAWFQSNRQPFESLGKTGELEFKVSASVLLSGFFTAQYGKMIHSGDRLEGAEKEDPLRVYSFVMSNGFIEHTLVQLSSRRNPEEGFTVEVEPLSGVVRLHPELLSPEDAMTSIPDTPPALP
jgi:type II secretory pathway pseudopilin PulG